MTRSQRSDPITESPTAWNFAAISFHTGGMRGDHLDLLDVVLAPAAVGETDGHGQWPVVRILTVHGLRLDHLDLRRQLVDRRVLLSLVGELPGGASRRP